MFKRSLCLMKWFCLCHDIKEVLYSCSSCSAVLAFNEALRLLLLTGALRMSNHSDFEVVASFNNQCEGRVDLGFACSS